jgi:hypothetical protein
LKHHRIINFSFLDPRATGILLLQKKITFLSSFGGFGFDDFPLRVERLEEIFILVLKHSEVRTLLIILGRTTR